MSKPPLRDITKRVRLGHHIVSVTMSCGHHRIFTVSSCPKKRTRCFMCSMEGRT